MMTQNERGWVVQVRFAEAQAVHLLGRFNNWSTTATPMQRGPNDVWEAVLATMPDGDELRFFVWRCGELGGRLCRDEAEVAA